MPVERQASLVCHPATPGDGVRGVEVVVSRLRAAALSLAFRLDGELTRIRIPPPRAPRIAAGLWRHTCFEAFVAADGSMAYHELNFSPSTEWTAYAFRAYRDGGPLTDEALAPDIAVRAAADRLEFDAIVSLDRLSPAYPSAPLRLGLSAVVESSDGSRSYWALRHPPGDPDFHHADAFALRLEPPDAEW